MASVWNLSELGNRFGKFAQRESLQSDDDEDLIHRGDFLIDLRSRNVSVRGEEVRLEQDEFEMLLFLIEHRTNIITPHTRLTTRWARERIHQSDFLRILAKLQKKIEGLRSGGQYIRTEPWIICRFDPGR